MTKTIFVKVPEPANADETPRTCAIHAKDNPHGGTAMLVPQALADLDGAVVGPFEVLDSPDIRRRIRSGDLVEATKPAPKSEAKTAAADAKASK